jgi:hypothetical protein
MRVESEEGSMLTYLASSAILPKTSENSCSSTVMMTVRYNGFEIFIPKRLHLCYATCKPKLSQAVMLEGYGSTLEQEELFIA